MWQWRWIVTYAERRAPTTMKTPTNLRLPKCMLYVCKDIWHLGNWCAWAKVKCEIYLPKSWVDFSSNLMVTADFFLLSNKKKSAISKAFLLLSKNSWAFVQFWLNLSTPTHQSGLQFCFRIFCQPWHSWGHVNSGVKHILDIYITVFWTPVISFWDSPMHHTYLFEQSLGTVRTFFSIHEKNPNIFRYWKSELRNILKILGLRP